MLANVALTGLFWLCYRFVFIALTGYADKCRPVGAVFVVLSFFIALTGYVDKCRPVGAVLVVFRFVFIALADYV